MRAVSDAQVRTLMEEMSKHVQIGRAALKADLDRKTARKYVAAGKLPTELAAPRTWRTREDPFDADWSEVEKRLVDAPGLEAKALFEWRPSPALAPITGGRRRHARPPFTAENRPGRASLRTESQSSRPGLASDPNTST